MASDPLDDGTLASLITAGTLAPSPDNVQAWRFGRDGDAITVGLAAERAMATDVLDMFSWIGVGAAIENIVLAASAQGLRASVELHEPADAARDPVAVIRCSAGAEPDPLAAWIDARISNRKPFDRAPLEPEIVARLADATGASPSLCWVTALDARRRLAALDARAMFVRLSHAPLHAELFEVLRFEPREVEQLRYGLDVRTLEVPGPGLRIMRAYRNWSTARWFNALGIGAAITRDVASGVVKAGAVCLITTDRQSAVGYVTAGRTLQRLWLAATAEGLAASVYGALPQYQTKVAIEPATFLPEQAEMLRAQRAPFEALFRPPEGSFPAIALRIGRPSGQPSGRNVRLPVEAVLRSPG